MKFSLSHWYPGSGLVLDYIDSRSLPFFLLWNMEISSVKTKAMIVMPAKVDTPACDIKLKGESIEIVEKKKLLGLLIDDQLKFEEHIAYRKLNGFRAIKGNILLKTRQP